MSSWFQFRDAFGDLDKSHDLPLSVYQFFQNGGSRAYILRVVAGDAATAKDATATALDAAAVAAAAKAAADANPNDAALAKA
ncbi:MAG TPA: hypothetical protein VIX73_04260, partial [Kofleriaceae bacterium]